MECFFRRPTLTCKPSESGYVNKAEFITPVFYALRFSIELYQNIASSVSGLLARRCPFTIHRPSVALAFITRATGVMSRIIYSLSRISGRSCAHILPKRWECIPSIAEPNAAPAIVRPTLTPVISAPILNGKPNVIFFRIAQAMSRVCSRPPFLYEKAAATFNCARNQVTCRNLFNLSARASAHPSVCVWSPRNSSEPHKGITRKYFMFEFCFYMRAAYRQLALLDNT